MAFRDIILAISVIFVWGINFIFIKLGLADLSPTVLGMVRFIFMIFPAVFFIKRPQVAWYLLLLYGTTISFGQFGLTFVAVSMNLPTGLVSILVQSQVFLTIIFSLIFYKENIKPNQLVAIVGSIAGLVLIGMGQYQGVAPFLPMFVALGAGLSWALGNMVIKKIGTVNPLSLVIWGNLSALLLFTLSSVGLYGVNGVVAQIQSMSIKGWAGVLFLVYVAGLFGYAGWGSLLARYESTKITPLALLLPVISLVVGYIVLDERLNWYHWSGVLLVVVSLLVQVFGGKMRALLR